MFFKYGLNVSTFNPAAFYCNRDEEKIVNCLVENCGPCSQPFFKKHPCDMEGRTCLKIFFKQSQTETIYTYVITMQRSEANNKGSDQKAAYVSMLICMFIAWGYFFVKANIFICTQSSFSMETFVKLVSYNLTLEAC